MNEDDITHEVTPIPRSNDFYHMLRRRIRRWLKSEDGKNSRWAEYLLAAPDLFHLLCRLALDKDVPTAHKARVAGAMAYFISPIDLIPDLLFGPVGFLDDIAMAAFVLNGIVNDVDPAIVRKHWAGDQDVLQLIQRIVNSADEMVGKGLAHKLKGLLSRQ